MSNFTKITEALYDSVSYESGGERFTTEPIIKLAQEKVNVNIRDEQGQTPLHRIARENTFFSHYWLALNDAEKKTLVQAMKNAGFDWNIKDADGNTPLLLSKARIDEGADLKLLREVGGADLNIKNNAGESLAHVVARKGYGWEQVKAYADAGVKFDVQDKQGNTPFHAYAAATYGGSPLSGSADPGKTASTFRELGVDLHAKNKAGKQAIDLYREAAAASEREFLKRVFGSIDEVKVRAAADTFTNQLSAEVDAAQPLAAGIKKSTPAQPEKPAAVAVKSGTATPAPEARATPAATKPGISPTLANHLKGGALGAVGVGAAIASGAPKTVEEGLKLGAEAILPGSTTAGNDVCKITGTVAGGVAGTAAAMGAGALAFGGTVVPTTPVGATVISVGAGAAAFTATQPVAKLGTEALCNAVLPDGVKNAANKALATLNSALTFGGSEKVAQNAHKQQVATGSQGKQ